MIKHIAFYCDTDSQIFGALIFARAFRERGWVTTFYLEKKSKYPASVLEGEINQYPTRFIPYSLFLDAVKLGEIHVIGFFSRASVISQFRRDFEDVYKAKQSNRPGIFTGYNGLSYEKAEEGLAWRLGYDAIALNGPRDYKIFENFLENSPFEKQNFFVTGLRSGQNKDVPDTLEKRMVSGRGRRLVFAEQVSVPADMFSRNHLVTELIRIAEQNPNWDIIVKCRVQKKENTFHYMNYSFEDLFSDNKKIPENLNITYTPLNDLLDECDLLLSVSSTAIFDAINRNIPAFSIADFGIKNEYGMHVFFNSNLLIYLSDIKNLENDCLGTANENWLRWVGARDATPSKLIDYFETAEFHCDLYSPIYYTKAQADLLLKLQKKSIFDSVKVFYRYIAAYLYRRRYR